QDPKTATAPSNPRETLATHIYRFPRAAYRPQQVRHCLDPSRSVWKAHCVYSLQKDYKCEGDSLLIHSACFPGLRTSANNSVRPRTAVHISILEGIHQHPWYQAQTLY